MICPEGCVPPGRDWAEIGAWVVGWLLVIAGWFVVNRLQGRRERRRELQSEIAELVRQVLDIQEQSLAYLATQGGSPESCSFELRISAALQRLAYGLARLQGDGIVVDTRLVEFRQAVTSREFQSPARKPYGADAAWPQEVSEKANLLVNDLETAFRAKKT